MSAFKRLFGRFRLGRGARPDDAEPPLAAVEWVVAGLGNPEPKWKRSRHNAGFMVVDRLAATRGAKLSRRRLKGLTADAKLAGASVMLVKPETYYNASGDCVAAILGYFHVPVERLVVVHDELDLEPGRLRLKRGGGSAGNRGVISIEEALGTAEFIRVRIGIGRTLADENDRDYLLKPMTGKEMEAFAPAIARACEAVETLVADGLERAMNRYNPRSAAAGK